MLLVILGLFYLLAPAGVLWLCRKYKWAKSIGPILLLYFIGAILANLGFYPEPGSQMADDLLKMQTLFTNAMIPLAIPLMLFSFTYRKSETRDQLIAMVTGLFAVVIAVVAGYPIFGSHIPDAPRVAGMYTACLTGGTVNMASVSKSLGSPDTQFVLLNTCDMIVSFTYLVFIMAIGIKLARKFLPVKTLDEAHYDDAAVRAEMEKADENPYKGLTTKSGMRDTAYLMAATLIIVGLSAGIAFGLTKLLPGSFMMYFILAITTLSIAASFYKPLHDRKYGYDIGMYFIYVFSIVVASMANVRAMDFTGALWIIGFLFFMEIVSLIIQVLTAKIFKVDADTAVIASVTYINSPPFVPMIAASMRNSRVLMPGLSIGVIGYAVGNYLGVLIFQILS
jgi:uncharacterized membrane protein